MDEEMKEGLFELANGDFQVVDLEEDAPLVTISFHNQARKIPQEVKRALVLQMIAPAIPKKKLPLWAVFMAIICGLILACQVILMVTRNSH